jgi:hypothetical protein
MQQHEVDAFVKAFLNNAGCGYDEVVVRAFLSDYLSGWPDSRCVSKFSIHMYTAVLDSLNVWKAAKEYYSERQNG